MRSIAAVFLVIAASLSTASAQQTQQKQPTQKTDQPQQNNSWAMDHGRAADAAAASAAAAAANAKAAAAAGAAPKAGQSIDFGVNGDNVIRAAPPQTPEQQKAEADARAAWEARCRPTVMTDREGLRRTRYAEPDCDLSRFNTAGTK
jgi:hypothetical protein